jgi:hypothetical protein
MLSGQGIWWFGLYAAKKCDGALTPDTLKVALFRRRKKKKKKKKAFADVVKSQWTEADSIQ